MKMKKYQSPFENAPGQQPVKKAPAVKGSRSFVTGSVKPKPSKSKKY